MAVHHSSLAALKRCPMKFKYGYVDGLQRKRQSLPLKRGIWLHFMLQVDALKRGIEHESLLVTPTEIEAPGGISVGLEVPVSFQDRLPPLLLTEHEEYPLDWKGALELLVDHQWNYLPDEVKDELTEGGQDLPTACRNIMRGYLWQHKDTLPLERPLLVEHEWKRSDDGANGLVSVVYGGRLDLLLRDARGRVVLRDWKTTKSLPPAEYRLMERQRLLYAWGIEPLLIEHGVKIDAIELDYLLTKTPTKPRQNQPLKPKTRKAKCPDCAGDGVEHIGTDGNPDVVPCKPCEGTGKRVPDQPSANELKGELSKAKVDTTPLVYYEALQEYGLELTAEHRARINDLAHNNGFYKRFPMPLSPRALAVTLRENAAVAHVGDQILKAPGTAWRVEDPGSRSCLHTCDFVSLCLGDLYGQDTSTIRLREYERRATIAQPDDDEE